MPSFSISFQITETLFQSPCALTNVPAFTALKKAVRPVVTPSEPLKLLSKIGDVSMGTPSTMTVGFAMAEPLVLSIAMIWLAHIGVDRALGYGLKYASGFTFTHLGRIGRKTS